MSGRLCPRVPELVEVMCRGAAKCGTFVSARPVSACPKCGDPKIAQRPVRPAG